MNDNGLVMAVRAQRDKIPMNVPVEQIISRGRSIRSRRRVRRLAGTLAVIAAAAVLAVTALGPSGHQAQLAAWTVTRQAGGKVSITIRQLRDPAGLQRTLAADGAPAFVFSGQGGVLCPGDFYPASPGLSDAIVQLRSRADYDIIVINPSLVPPGVRVAIFDDPRSHPIGIAVALMQSTRVCSPGPLVSPAG